MAPPALTEAEIQYLIVLIELEAPATTPNNAAYVFNPRTPEEAALYFGPLKVDWATAPASLAAKGLVRPGSPLPSLSAEGLARASEERLARPPIYYWYERFYAEAPESPAFSRFCELLYGKAFCQDGFSDMDQVRALIGAARVGRGDRVLDLGCGPGLIARFVADETGASVTGLDYSPTAIARAKALERPGLSFVEGNLDDIPFPPGSFDAILSIDSLYMPNDLVGTLVRMRGLLRVGGRMALFYTHALSRPDESRENLLADRSPLGEALRKAGLAYRAVDFTAENLDFMRRKRKAAESLRSAFETEGRSYLYDYLIEQSYGDESPRDPSSADASRYLYAVDPASTG